MPDWVVRTATRAEELVAAAHLFDEPVTPDSAEDYLARPGQAVLLVHADDGRPVGFCSTVLVAHPDKRPEVLVYELAVDEDWRRRGVASALLAAVREQAERDGHRGVWVLTEPDNAPALATYTAAGAAREDAVVLTWDL